MPKRCSRRIRDRRLESCAFLPALGIAVLGAVAAVPSAHALTPRTSCPLSTEVYPFPEQSLGSYEVQITDGGPGDVDNAIDGVCLFRTRACLGSGGAAPEPCEAAHIDSFSAKVLGRLDRSVRDATAESAAEGVSRLFDGPENPGPSVDLATVPLAEGRCVDVPVRVPAGTSLAARRKLRIAFTVGVTTAEGERVDYTSRLRLKCNPRPPSGRVRTLCRTYGRACTDGEMALPPGVPGPPPPPGTLEPVPPPPPTKTLLPAETSPPFGQTTTTTTVWFETTKATPRPRKTTTTSVPPSTTTTSAPPPPTTTTTASPPPTTTTSLPPPTTTTTTAPPPPTTTTSVPTPPTTTTTEPPPPTTTTTLPAPPTTTTTEPPPPTTSTTEPLPPTTSTTEPLPPVTTTSVPLPPTTTTTEPPPPTTTTTEPLPPTTTTTEPPTTTTTEPLPPTTTTTEPLPPTTTTSVPLPPTTTTTLAPPPPSEGSVYYLSPSGDDLNSGTSVVSPWRTFDRVLNASKLLRPGDTLVLLDGTYTRTTTGLPRIYCGTPGTASNGEAGRPITIRALNERQAHLQSDGLATAFEMSGCSWWIVEGLRASNADNRDGTHDQGYPFRFIQVSNVTGVRLLGSHNNRQQNTHVFAVELSQNVLLEECEAYYFHRHGFSIWKSRYVDLRRCYANSMLYGVKGCCSSTDTRSYGDEAYSLYGTSDTIVENCISENRANGFQIHGIGSPLDPSGHGGRNNRILGSISLDDALPSLISSRASTGTYHNASGNVFENFLAALGGGHGIFLRGSAGNHVENATLYGSTASGLIADDGNGGNGATCSTTLSCATSGVPCSVDGHCQSNDLCTQNTQGCGFTARNVLAMNNGVYGFRSTDQTSWLVEYSNASGNAYNYGVSDAIDDLLGYIRSSMSTVPTEVGMGAGQCLAWIPASSNMTNAGMGGGPLGASILFRYENGSLTTQPLWDPATRAFPCGAVVPGLNDGSPSCANLHTRLGITGAACQLPPGYGG